MPDDPAQALHALTQQIQDAHRRAFGHPGSFEMRRCWCGSPMWSEPCAICDFDSSWAGARATAIVPRNSCTFRRFAHQIQIHGNIAAWHFACLRRLLAYRMDESFAIRVERLVDEALTWTDLPDAETLWNLFHAETDAERSCTAA